MFRRIYDLLGNCNGSEYCGGTLEIHKCDVE